MSNRVGFKSLAIAALLALAAAPAAAEDCAGVHDRQKIVVVFDGTWNNITSNTNPFRLAEEVEAVRDQGAKEGGPQIQVFYDRGLGTDGRKLTGGGLGYGFARNVRDGYRYISDWYKPCDQIYIFGFSRGAFTARTLASMIEQVGILNREAFLKKDRRGNVEIDKSAFRNAVEEAFKITKDIGKDVYTERHPDLKPLWTLNDIWRKITPEAAVDRLEKKREKSTVKTVFFHPDIEVVGVWDTVASLGITHLTPEKLYLVNLEDLRHVKRAYQALSIDEDRPSFRPLMWTESESVAPGQVLEQVWFPGGHADVGGGFFGKDVAPGTMNLADLSLSWMASRLRKDGLVRPGFAELTPEQQQAVSTATRHALEQLWAKTRAPRAPKDDSVLHASVCDRIAAPIDLVTTKKDEKGEKRERSKEAKEEPVKPYRPKGIFPDGNRARTSLRFLGEGSTFFSTCTDGHLSGPRSKP